MQHLVEIKESKIHGKGVFAIENIPEGTIVNVSEVALVLHEWDLPECLATIEFPWNETHYAICLSGVGSFFNHAKDFNTVVEPDFEKKQQVFRTNRRIEKGEELCFYYNDAFEAYVNALD